MSRFQIIMTIDIDTDALADHVGVSEQRGGPYATDPAEWDASDVFAAADHGIIDPQECVLDTAIKA